MWFRRYRRMFEGEEGISLVEMMVAVFILAVALMALAAVTTSSVASLRVSRTRQLAVDAVSATLEQARALDYAEVAHPLGAGPATSPNGETVIESADGVISHTGTAGVAGEVTLETYVTWVSQTDGATTIPHAARRVTTVATWTDNGQTRTVTETTTISNAERGLPVPNFGVQPPTGGATVQPGYKPTDPCPSQSRFHHTLTNVGAEDSYEVRVAGNGHTVTLSGTKFSSSNTKWAAEVYLTTDSEDPPAAPASDPNSALMDDRAPVGDQHVEAYDNTNSEIRISTGESVFLTVCYFPDPALDKNVTNASFTVTVRSRFDNAITEQFTHSLFVATDAATLYLHDPDNTKDHTRPNNPAIFAMDTNATTQSAGPFNYDTNLDPDAMSGLWLKDGDSASSVSWDWQTPSQVVIDDASLLLWAALDDGDDSGEHASFTITLQEVSKNGNTVLGTFSPNMTVDPALSSERLKVFPAADRTFKSGSLTWNFNPVTIEAQNRLRLKLTCHNESTDDCHLLYDHANFLSRLAVSG